jgi:hypothetical protein
MTSYFVHKNQLFENLGVLNSFMVPCTMKEKDRPIILKQIRDEAARQSVRLGRVFTVHAKPLGITVRRQADDYEAD